MKGLEDELPQPTSTPHERTAPSRVKPLLLLLAVSLLSFAHLSKWISSSTSLSSFQSNGIYWQPCPDNVETFCSFLRVPLDYTNPKSNETVSLALRMLPSTVPPSEQLGYLFINPGGPGGSGTASVLLFGSKLQVILEGRYNVISWDPRGVNLTSPALGCFSTEGDANRFLRDITNLGTPYDSQTPHLDSASQRTIDLRWTSKFDAYTKALQMSCDENADQGIMKGSSTAFTARDMWSIAQALGEEKVNYWGFSYGTILGATFAAMFPDKINRFILDGVSDSASYTQDFWQWGKDGMTDTRKTFEGFLSSCADSGPSGCAFASSNSTQHSLERRLEALYERLRESPLAVGSSSFGPGIITASDVQWTMFHSLYAPRTWPNMASLLSEVERGDGRRMYETMNKDTRNTCQRSPSKNPFHHSMFGSMASAAVVMCGDTDPRVIQNDTSVERLRDYMGEMKRETKSPTSDMWAIWTSQCRNWSPKPLEVYRGPWTVEDGLKKTSYQIVFLSLTADPVTPLAAARRMVDNFGPDSATLLIQNGFGHCSVSHPSTCTAKKARSYFLEGEVPKMNTTCDADPGYLFPDVKGDKVDTTNISREDEELRRALEELAEATSQREWF